MKPLLFKALRNSLYLLVSGLLKVTGTDRRSVIRLARFLGVLRSRVGYVGRDRNRRLYLETIGRALPALPAGGREKILLDFWINHQASFLELFLSPGLTPAALDHWVEFEGLEHLEQALAAGHGALLTTMHMGDERLLHILLALKGFPIRALSADFSDYGWAARRARLKAASAFHPLETGRSHRWMFRSLKAGEAVFMAISGFGGRRGAWVDLLGRNILFSSAPARLALRTGAPLLTTVCLRRPDGRCLVRVDPPLPMPEDNTGDTAIHRVTSDLVDRFRPVITAEPGQLNWMWYIIRHLETDPRIGGIHGNRT
jgi:KDO2-lipid IV(A) lauroyltransferase